MRLCLVGCRLHRHKRTLRLSPEAAIPPLLELRGVPTGEGIVPKGCSHLGVERFSEEVALAAAAVVEEDALVELVPEIKQEGS